MNDFFIRPGFTLKYETEMSISECIHRIAELPWEYKDTWSTPLWYKCTIISNTQLHITFSGGQFRKAMTSQYRAHFSVENGITMITLVFQREMLGLPGLTPPSDIDLFMKEKINASRTALNYDK